MPARSKSWRKNCARTQPERESAAGLPAVLWPAWHVDLAPRLRYSRGFRRWRIGRLWQQFCLVTLPVKSLPTSEFSLRQATPLSDHAMLRSEVVVSGSPTGKIIAGAELEAAIQWNDFFLAFGTDDIPQEDTLRIYLFDRQLNLVDSATLGAMYSTGSFSELELVPPNTVGSVLLAALHGRWSC